MKTITKLLITLFCLAALSALFPAFPSAETGEEETSECVGHVAGKKSSETAGNCVYRVRRCVECEEILEKEYLGPVRPFGDANGDGGVTSGDIVRLKKYFAAYDPDTETSEVEVFDAADANGDGKISSGDVVRLKKYFAAFDPDAGVSDVSLGPEISEQTSKATLEETEDAGEEYINKITFLGDSRTYGLSVYKALAWERILVPRNGTLHLYYTDDAKVVDYEAETENGVEFTIKDAVEFRKPEIFLISLGVNGVSTMTEEEFAAAFGKLISDARKVSPDTKIILTSMIPVARSYEKQDKINNAKITRANGWIRDIAENSGCYFLDYYDLFIEDDGFLSEKYQNGDGLHLEGTAYKKIVEYVRTHALPGVSTQN